jgi:hypothetical protein
LGVVVPDLSIEASFNPNSILFRAVIVSLQICVRVPRRDLACADKKRQSLPHNGLYGLPCHTLFSVSGCLALGIRIAGVPLINERYVEKVVTSRHTNHERAGRATTFAASQCTHLRFGLYRNVVATCLVLQRHPEK